MNEEKLKLPASAAAHWEPACRILHKVWGATDTKVQIGGGAVLAARWRHRGSTDLDFKLSWPSGIREHGPGTGQGARLHEAMAARGYRCIIRADTRLVFEHTPTKMRVDLSEATPASRPGRTWIEAPGWGRIEALDTDEILVSKIQGRLINPPVRDLFDFAVAARVEPRVWTEVINTAHQDEPGQAISSWATQRFHYRVEARAKLDEVAEQWKHLAEEAWAHACAAVQHATWNLMTVRYTTEGAVVQGHGPRGVEYQEHPRTDARKLYQKLYNFGVRPGHRAAIIEHLRRRIGEGTAGQETCDTVKEAQVPSPDEEPLLAPACELLRRDLDWRRRQEKTWPQYRLVEGEGGLTLLVREDPQGPERIEGQGLSLDALVRRERELRGWPEESEGAIRAFAVQQMRRGPVAIRTHPPLATQATASKRRGDMRNSQGIYEPGQEARGLPGPEAYGYDAMLRFEPVTDERGNRLYEVPYWEIPEPHWIPDEDPVPHEPRGDAWREVRKRLALSSAGAIAHPDPQDVSEAVRAKGHPSTDTQRVAERIWIREATWEEIEAGHAAGLYTWRELVEWLHATQCAGGRWRFAHARRLCSQATPEGQREAYRRAPWHE